jgi:hypothetical protein
MSIIDDAIQRVQAIALACTDVVITSAPALPVDDSMSRSPTSIAYLKDGEIIQVSAGFTRWIASIGCDIYFNRTSVKEAYRQIQLFIPDMVKRLGGDPTLNGTVDNIIYPIKFNVVGASFGGTDTLYQVIQFDIPVKFNLASTTTP